jgi:1-acyl-sn-glycerol-3-phosphate acyltransferase
MSAPTVPTDVRAGTMRPRTHALLQTLLMALSKAVVKLHVVDDHNVPREGGVIVVANHVHNLDPLFISIACPRALHYMAKKELMDVPVLGRILRWGGAFPINRGHADRTAIRRATATVEQGVALGMFPEGTRSRTVRIERVLPGAGLVALQGKVPIVPAAITGTERLPFNGSKQHHRGEINLPDPGHKGVRVIFGEPFTIPPTIDGKRTNADAATDFIMRRVAELLPPAYRGIYGDPPTA